MPFPAPLVVEQDRHPVRRGRIEPAERLVQEQHAGPCSSARAIASRCTCPGQPPDRLIQSVGEPERGQPSPGGAGGVAGELDSLAAKARFSSAERSS
jgi:hypothetical protein